MAFEHWSSTVVDGIEPGELRLRGNQRSYLMLSPDSVRWGEMRHDRLRLLGKTLQVTVLLAKPVAELAKGW